jgi:outer membrane cobalamin receptor
VGAQLRRQGGRDDFATLSIRGAPSGQVQILLDGVALGRASDSVVNLADLPIDTVDRIEIYRGFAPVGLTPVSAAGVVNIVTRDPDRPVASVAAGLGSFDSGKINVGAAAPVAGGTGSAFASLRTTNGDFQYVYDKGTLNNFADGVEKTRANNDSNAVDALTRWRRDVASGLDVLVRNHFFYKDEGVPPELESSPLHARLETVRDIATAALEGSGGRWSVEQGATYQSETLSDYATLDNEGVTAASTTTGRWNHALGKSNWLSGSGNLVYENFDQHFSSSPRLDQSADRWSLAVAGGDDWTVDALHATLSLQLRHQELWNQFDSASVGGGNGGSDRSTDPRLGLRWQPFHDIPTGSRFACLDGFAVKTNVSSYFRPPTFDELYGVTGFSSGNPNLKPETGTTRDLGFEWTVENPRFGSVSLGYAWFASDIHDVIVVELTFDRSAKAFNDAEARIRGHEVRVEWQAPLGLALSANYTRQDAVNETKRFGLQGKELAGLPPEEAYARLSWTRGPFVVAYDVDVSGKHYTDSENAYAPLPTRVVHDVSLVFGPFWNGFRVTVEGNNLGNTLIPDEIGFPLPGRAFYATLSWSGDWSSLTGPTSAQERGADRERGNTHGR